MENFDNIYKLNCYLLTDSEGETLVMSDIKNTDIFEELITEFREISGYNNEDGFNEGYDYTTVELEEFIVNKGYFFYIPRSDSNISF